MIKSGVTYRILSDQVGSVRLVVNADTGAIAQWIDYDAFGVVTQDTNPGFQPFGFAGGLTDHDTGLVRFGARDYDPKVGRWTSKDPIRFDLGETAQYLYALSDPVNLLDANGLWAASAEGYIPVGIPGLGGWGGRASLGWTRNGHFFLSLGAGLGVGGGLGIDPTAQPPGYEYQCPSGAGFNLSLIASAGAALGLGGTAEKRLGFGLDGPGGPRAFNETAISGSVSLDDVRLRFSRTASATLNLTIVGN